MNKKKHGGILIPLTTIANHQKYQTHVILPKITIKHQNKTKTTINLCLQ